jgi:hypothetical protein
MARERANTEALIVLLLEMFIFLGFCFGVQAVIRASDEQPALVTTVVIGLALCTAVMAAAAAINEFSDDGEQTQGAVFVMVRAAWHFSFASSMNAKTFAALVVTADDSQHRNWSLLLLQTQTHEMENRFFTAAQNGWVLGVVSVVVLMHSVFYSKTSRGTEQHNCDVGRMTTVLAFSALLVQYTTERALGRLCAVGPLDDPQRPDEIASCELQLLPDKLSADYTFFGTLAAVLTALFVSDVLVCILHAKLLSIVRNHSTVQHARSLLLELLHAFFALVPCAAYVVCLFAGLQYTTPVHLLYLYSVGLLLAFSCVRRVWTALSRRAQHLAALRQAGFAEALEVADVMHDAGRHEQEPHVQGQPAETLRGVIIKGTAQQGARLGELKKRQ